MAKGYQKLALLGTVPTMANDFFKAPFRAKGLDIVVPKKGEQALIHNRISAELEFGVVTDDTVHALRSIAERMIREERVEAVILGCTELALAFDHISFRWKKWM